jgi:5'-nucleotidase
MLGVNLMMLGSGSIRKTELGPVVTVADLYAIFPFAEAIWQLKMKGSQIRQAFEKVLLPENMTSSNEHYQVNEGTEIVYDNTAKKVVSIRIGGTELDNDAVYSVGIASYHYNNLEKFLGIPLCDVVANGKPIVLTTSQTDVIEEYFMSHNNLNAKTEGRIRRVN